MRTSRKLLIIFIFFFTLVGSARFCQAIPTQFGDSGLVSQPTAETLNSGNICVGIIGNCAENDGELVSVLPVFMTLGLGSFLEAYGSYPNVLFNENEEESGRGFSNVGFKIRVYGKRSAQFKLALDGQLRRTVSSNINYDGLTDKVFRAIASYNNGTFGLHGNAGYINPENPQYISYDNQLIYGGGLEYLPNSRMRLLTEIGIETAKSQGLSDRAEVSAGFQYFLSPHLTFNLALAKGFTDESPDWRALVGFSSCQGIGTYQRPIPRKVAPQVEEPEEAKVEVKALKVKTLTPLSPKKKVVEPVKSSSKYEVPVGEKAEVVTLSPASPVSEDNNISAASGAVLAAAAGPMAISSGIPLLQVAPEIAGSVAATALALPVNEALALPASRPARSYKLNEVVKTDENQVVGKKIVEDIRYQAKFYSITETPTTFSATFFHKYDKPLDVWIEGAGKASVKLSQSKAAPYEEIILTVNKVNGKVPYFKLHLGELSEVFEFFPLRKSVKLGKIEIDIKPVSREQGNNLQASNAGQGVKTTEPVESSSAVTPSIHEGSKSGEPGIGAVSVAPPIGGGVTALSTAAAPQSGAVAVTASDFTSSAGVRPLPEVGVSPKAGDVSTIDKVSKPIPQQLTGAASTKAAPEASHTKVVPSLSSTPGGSTVILLDPGTSPVPGQAASTETIVVQAPVSGPLTTIPSKTVQAVAYKKFRLPSTVIFAFDDATLTEEGKAAITDVVEAITTEKRWYVLRVDGFTDSFGSDDYNMKLGLRRAISVGRYMVTNNGIDPAIIFVKSSGENDPIATNETEEGRSLNRRAEVVLFVQKEE